MNMIKLNNTAIKKDSSNRYCLNDLHKAAIKQGKANNQQRPSSFLRNETIKRFVQSLSDAQNCASVTVVKGGLAQGTYAHELVVLRYAAWLDTEFEIAVYKAFKDFMLGGIDVITRLNTVDRVIGVETSNVSHCARVMRNWGVGGRKELLHGERAKLVNEAQMYLPEIN